MSVSGASFNNWINEATATQLLEFRVPLSLGDSELLAKLVREVVRSNNVSIAFSLVGVCSQQRFFSSADSVLLVSHTLAPQRTWIAVALKMSTHGLATLVQPGGDLYGLEKKRDICYFGDGFPYWSGRRSLGGIGISGGNAEEGMPIARQAVVQFSVLCYSFTTTH